MIYKKMFYYLNELTPSIQFKFVLDAMNYRSSICCLIWGLSNISAHFKIRFELSIKMRHSSGVCFDRTNFLLFSYIVTNNQTISWEKKIADLYPFFVPGYSRLFSSNLEASNSEFLLDRFRSSKRAFNSCWLKRWGAYHMCFKINVVIQQQILNWNDWNTDVDVSLSSFGSLGRLLNVEMGVGIGQ